MLLLQYIVQIGVIMIPLKAREQKAVLQDTLNNPQACFEDHQGEFLIGVYNTKTQQIFLLPCIKELVWLELDEKSGKYTRGWKATRDTETLIGSAGRGEELSMDDVKKYNNSPLPPRVISIQNKVDLGNLTWPHTFVVELLDGMSNKGDYRGFSVMPGKNDQETKYQWNSASLNMGVTNLSKVMPQEFQNIIKSAISQWGKKDSINHNVQLDNIQKKMTEDLLAICKNHRIIIEENLSLNKDIVHVSADGEKRLGAINNLIDILESKLSNAEKIKQFQTDFKNSKQVFTQGDDSLGARLIHAITCALANGYKAGYLMWRESCKAIEHTQKVDKLICKNQPFKM